MTDPNNYSGQQPDYQQNTSQGQNQPNYQNQQNQYGQPTPQYTQNPNGQQPQAQGQYNAPYNAPYNGQNYGQNYAQPNQQQYTPAGGYGPQPGYAYAPQVVSSKSKIAAGLLGIFLGAFGVHNFYLGQTGKAVAQLLITLLSFGFLSGVSAIWGLIEGIMILVSHPGNPWHQDAQGFELQE